MLKKSKTKEEFCTIFSQLMDDEQMFGRYYGMSQYDFRVLLRKIEKYLKEQGITFKRAIRPIAKLAVCLK